jgi:hypothetical protein
MGPSSLAFQQRFTLKVVEFASVIPLGVQAARAVETVTSTSHAAIGDLYIFDVGGNDRPRPSAGLGAYATRPRPYTKAARA